MWTQSEQKEFIDLYTESLERSGIGKFQFLLVGKKPKLMEVYDMTDPANRQYIGKFMWTSDLVKVLKEKVKGDTKKMVSLDEIETFFGFHTYYFQ